MSDQKNIKMHGNPEKFIPKFSNSVSFNRLDNGDVVINFAYLPDGSNNNTPDQAAIIESFVVSDGHAHKIVEVLSDVLKSTEEKE